MLAAAKYSELGSILSASRRCRGEVVSVLIENLVYGFFPLLKVQWALYQLSCPVPRAPDHPPFFIDYIVFIETG